MKISFIILSLLISGSCAKVKKYAKGVEVIIIKNGDKQAFELAQEKLVERECELIKEVIAPIAMGGGSAEERLTIALKNKVAENGGNTVVTYLREKKLAMKTRGMAYLCPEVE